VIADPKRFNWLPIEGTRGVDHKYRVAATAGSTLEVFLVGLPPVVLPETESAEYDVDATPDQAAEPVGSAAPAG
jgi:hypothetical protein